MIKVEGTKSNYVRHVNAEKAFEPRKRHIQITNNNKNDLIANKLIDKL
jgi:hypothetical protein